MEKYQLTPVEHELMEIIWKLGQGTVRDVIACLHPTRHLAYTSVSTILRILQQKNILKAVKAGKQHIYQPLLSKETYAAHSVKNMVKQVFAGDSVNLVAYLVNKNDLSLDDIQAIQTLLESKKKELGK